MVDSTVYTGHTDFSLVVRVVENWSGEAPGHTHAVSIVDLILYKSIQVTANELTGSRAVVTPEPKAKDRRVAGVISRVAC